MSSYEEYLAAQRAKQAGEVEALNAVLSAGETLNLWRTLPDEGAGHEGHIGTHREVETAEGNRYSLTVTKGGRISASVAWLSSLPHQCGLRVHPSDVTRDTELAPTATADPAQGAERAAKSLHRRVIVPGAVIATRMREKMAERQAQRAALLAAIEQAKAQGLTEYQHGGLSDSEFYEAKLWHTDLGPVRVTAAGAAYIERTVTVRLSDVATLAALTRRGR